MKQLSEAYKFVWLFVWVVLGVILTLWPLWLSLALIKYLFF